MSRVVLANADIVTAYDNFTIGSKVTNRPEFHKAAIRAISDHDFSMDKIPGQGFLVCPEAIPFVSAGDAQRSPNAEDYFPAEHRGQIGLYMKRDVADHDAEELGAKFCALVVYTKEAYLADPDVTPEEAERLERENNIDGYPGHCTHVLVAVIASRGPESPLTPYRFVHNLAGGNKEALVWTADEIRTKAKEILDHANEWCVVAG